MYGFFLPAGNTHSVDNIQAGLTDWTEHTVLLIGAFINVLTSSSPTTMGIYRDLRSSDTSNSQEDQEESLG